MSEQAARGLREALERFVLAVEQEDELLSNSGCVWDAYEAARAVLGRPVVSFPGGYADEHFHLYEWTEYGHCDTCEDYRAEQRQAEPAPEEEER